MEQQIVSYIKKHTFLIAMLVIAGFLLLGAGEYMLYRQQMHLNKMISEGFMQVKENQQQEIEYDEMEGVPAGTESMMMEK